MYLKHVIICVVTVLLIASCSKAKDAANKEVKNVPVLKITKKDTLVSNQFVTDIQAKRM